MKEKEEGEELDRGRIWLVIYAWQHLGQSTGSMEQELLLSGSIIGPSWSTCCLTEACYPGQMVLCSWSSPCWGWEWRLPIACTCHSWSTSILRRGICVIHLYIYHCCSVFQSCPTLCDPHRLQHTRLLCPSPSPEVCPRSCPLHRWCHPAISSSDALFCSQFFPTSGTFPISQVFTSDDQNTGVSASASVLPTSLHDWFPLRLTGLTSLLSKGLWGVFCSTIIQRHQFFGPPPSLWSSSHNHRYHWEDHSLDYMDVFSRVMSAFQHTA